jgi:hypothetical protein
MTKDEALKLAQEALEVLEKHRQIKGGGTYGDAWSAGN